jgi:hypothetical protein
MSTEPIEERLAALAERLTAVELAAARAQNRGDVENVFSRYMHYHDAFEDERTQYEAKLMYFGDDGKPVFLPPVDGPTVTRSLPYQIDSAQQLVPEPPQPYTQYEDTFR